jgi:hypothetical protein
MRVDAEGLDRVVDDVLREQPHATVRIDPCVVHALQVVDAEADHAHVAEVHELAAVEARRAVHLPAADQAVHARADIAGEAPALAERQLPDPRP